MNLMNDLNIPPDPPETWQAKITRLVKDVFLPYAVPYIIPLFLGWSANRRLTRAKDLEAQNEEQMASMRAEISALQKRSENARIPYSGQTIQEQLSSAETRERKRLDEIFDDLEKMSVMLKKRQDVYCSLFRSRINRKDVEEEMREFAYKRDYDKDLQLYRGVEDILANDTYCGLRKEDNGCLMWVYMDLWKARAKLKMQEHILNEIKE